MTALWSFPIPIAIGGPGVRAGQFGFYISGNSNQTVIVESATNLTYPVWTPVGTNVLVAGSAYFSDPLWTNYPGCVYRLRSP